MFFFSLSHINERVKMKRKKKQNPKKNMKTNISTNIREFRTIIHQHHHHHPHADINFISHAIEKPRRAAT